jgi:hypothetical protein
LTVRTADQTQRAIAAQFPAENRFRGQHLLIQVALPPVLLSPCVAAWTHWASPRPCTRRTSARAQGASDALLRLPSSNPVHAAAVAHRRSCQGARTHSRRARAISTSTGCSQLFAPAAPPCQVQRRRTSSVHRKHTSVTQGACRSDCSICSIDVLCCTLCHSELFSITHLNDFPILCSLRCDQIVCCLQYLEQLEIFQ